MDKPKQIRTDILVIGGGPAGTVAASILQKKGYKVYLVEKQQFPRFVIGESLLPRCMDNLEKAGFIEAIEQAGFQKKHGAMFASDDKVCSFDFSERFTEGWAWTWQVQRAKFDQVLADQAAKNGVEVVYSSAMTGISFEEDGTSSSTIVRDDGFEYTVTARFVIDGSGYGRVLSQLLNLDKPSEFPSRASLFCHVKPQQVTETDERKQIIIIVCDDNTWGWVIPFADGTSSIGIVGDENSVNRFTGTPAEQMRQWIGEVPALRDRFTMCEFIFDPKTITGYSTAVHQLYGKNYVLTGNSAEFVDPIFSSGVTFATESAALAAELIHKQLSGQPVDWEAEYANYIKEGVDVFKSFIQYWYDGSLQKIFFTEKSNPLIKQQICSILAGYVWDKQNPFVRKHQRAIPALVAVLD